ncbi:MAG: hypothetical protein DHS20C05_09460 [Hyphococcus sp.]|nr:MAG: hypothetical protein DHS20C05_09460 [Marinicaulis sp.]
MAVFYWFHLLLSLKASILRLGAGGAAQAVTPEKPIILYEFEGCPFCRIAREAVSQSGVSVLVRPCPKGGKRFRPHVKKLGGKAQFPFLVDENADLSMYESRDISTYLHKNYGGNRSWQRFLGPIDQILSQLAVLIRLLAGTFVKKSVAPETPLEFIGAERDPRARLVKEILCEMELEYHWHPKGGDGESKPALNDPNTKETITGAQAIRDYLRKTYRS